MMNPTEARAAWVEALRSGDFIQYQGALANRDHTRHCCLGVACELAIEDGVKLERMDAGHDGDYVDEVGERGQGILPVVVLNWLGLRTPSGSFYPNADAIHSDGLASQNDDGATFDEIADIIEAEPEGLIK